jgi:hypothetical protein
VGEGGVASAVGRSESGVSGAIGLFYDGMGEFADLGKGNFVDIESYELSRGQNGILILRDCELCFWDTSIEV